MKPAFSVALEALKRLKGTHPLILAVLLSLILVGAEIVPSEALIGFCSSIVITDNPDVILSPR